MKFPATDFSLGDAPQLGRPFEVDSDQIKILTENSYLNQALKVICTSLVVFIS